MHKTTLKFSGHETFHCKQLWLKKGYDYLETGKSLYHADAIMELGIGKNMVKSLIYWLEAFDITNDHKGPTHIAKNLFSDDGWDPYIEDMGTIWLLHFLIVQKGYASLYNLFFNKFRKQRLEFTETHIKLFLQTESQGTYISSVKTLEKDIKVFLKNYILPARKSSNIEDDFSILFSDLRLVTRIDKDDAGRESWYKTQNGDHIDLPFQIVFFSIMHNKNLGLYSDTISFFELLNGYNSPGSVFTLHADALYTKVQQIVDRYEGIVFKEDADVKTIQIKKEYHPLTILKEYYVN